MTMSTYDVLMLMFGTVGAGPRHAYLRPTGSIPLRLIAAAASGCEESDQPFAD
jgi:hypothetical protein